MAEGLRGHRGGSLGLLDLLEDHWEALDYDLLTLGLDINRIGSPDLDWRRLKAVVRYLPPTSALHRSMYGAQAEWGVTEHLLASAVDALRGANWQRSGGKGKRPEPIPRPGDEDKRKKRYGTASIPLEEAKAFFDRVNRRRH